MIFAREMGHFGYSYTGKVKHLKCRLSSVKLTLDNHTFTARCKSDQRELSPRNQNIFLFYSLYLDDLEQALTVVVYTLQVFERFDSVFIKIKLRNLAEKSL